MVERKTILYAEDNQSVRRVYERLLRTFFSEPDYYVEVFNNGTALEERLGQGRDGIGVVVTDDQMPGKNGTRIIKEWARKLPIILHSTCGRTLARFAIEDGAFAYLEKGSSNEEFVMTVAYALDPTSFRQSSQ